MFCKWIYKKIFINSLLEPIGSESSLLYPCSKGEGVYCFTLVCPSVCLSVTNFRHSFLSNYSLQRLEIVAHSFLWHAIGWESFLYELDVNFLFVRSSVLKVYNKFLSQFPQQLLIAGAWNFSTLLVVACHMVGLFLYESDVNFLFICASVHRVYNKF
jgi:hypothetical protein